VLYPPIRHATGTTAARAGIESLLAPALGPDGLWTPVALNVHGTVPVWSACRPAIPGIEPDWVDHSCMAFDWLPLATTTLGGVLAAGGGALAQWISNRRTDTRARAERRHTAYVDFLMATDGVWPLLWNQVRWQEDVRTDFLAILGRLDRAAACVSLAGPSSARDAADVARRAAWAVFLFFDQEAETEPEAAKLQALVDEWSKHSGEFASVARATLGAYG
jgi:hypothetical protein